MNKITKTQTMFTSLIAMIMGLVLVASPTHAAIKNNTIADETTPRTITIWKYEIKDYSEFGERGNGEDATVTKTPLAGIKFRVERVTPLNNASLVDPLTSKLGVDYKVDTAITAQEVSTIADGSAKIELGKGTKVDGTYLITELPDTRDVDIKVTKVADPFFVHVPQTKRDTTSDLIYDIKVHPKNILDSLLLPEKTIMEGEGFSNKAGQDFTWEAMTNVPNGLFSIASQNMTITPVYDDEGNIIDGESIDIKKGQGVYADYFEIKDSIHQLMGIKKVDVQVKKTSGNWESLKNTTDYKLIVDNKPVTDTNLNIRPKTQQDMATTIKVQLTKPADNSVPSVKSGMQRVQEYDKIRVVYTTYTKTDFNGMLENKFEVTTKTPGLKPKKQKNPKTPLYFTGGFQMTKLAEDTKKPLANAEFHISETKADAANNIFMAENGKSYGKANGTIKDAEAAAKQAQTTLLTTKTGADGIGRFDGLALNWFTDTNKDGKQNANEPTWNLGAINKSYWVTETKAPKDYELLKEAKEVNVKLNVIVGQTNNLLTVTNKKKTEMPFTGGTGKSMLIIAGLGVIIVGSVLYTTNNKKPGMTEG